jgi:hypothetical protein
MRRNAHWFSLFAGFLLGAGLTETRQILSHGYGRYKPSAAHFDTMKQRSFDLNQSTRKTRKQVFLQQMEAVGTWAALVEFMARFYSEGRNARPPSVLQTMLRVRFMQPMVQPVVPGHGRSLFSMPGGWVINASFEQSFFNSLWRFYK